MIRSAERLHKRPAWAILTAHDVRPGAPRHLLRARPRRVGDLAERIHGGRGARRPQDRRGARRGAARVRHELCHRRRVHQERRTRGAGDLRRRPVVGAAGPHSRHRDERARGQRVHRARGARRRTREGRLRRGGDRSFNASSVAGDSSTNDTALLVANGASGVDPGRDGAVWKLFEEAVQHVARALALAIVEDGEGASKLVEIQVVGAASEAAAREVGRAIARSTLVKTAIYGADPNWGRILAAAGAAGVALAVERLTLQAAVNGEWLTLAQGGATAHPDPERAHAIFRQNTN